MTYKNNILVTSLGTSWSIIPELIGFTNHDIYNLYKNHPESKSIIEKRKTYNIQAVDEVWVVTTNGNKVIENLKVLKRWRSKVNNIPTIKLFSYNELTELNTLSDIAPMTDLIYRTVLHARDYSKGGKLFLSLAGGRKNMSVDIQNAAYIFGCDALLHVMDNGNIDEKYKFNDQTEEEQTEVFNQIPGKEIKCFNPIVLHGKIPSSPILFSNPKIESLNYPLAENLKQRAKTDLLLEIQKRQTESANTLFSIYQSINRVDSQNSFIGFQLLHPELREKLKKDKIGANNGNKQEEINWLKKLPKPELHCHLGGILSPAEMIEVAKQNKEEVSKMIKDNTEFGDWYFDLVKKVQKNDISLLPDYQPKLQIRDYWEKKGVPLPLPIAAFILAFEENANLLENYIYNSVEDFKGIGIHSYERLGDLQGSSLLQNEKSLRKTCRILKYQCYENNIKYLELRCSPIKYTMGNLNSEKVVDIIIDELKNNETTFKLIFIVSRHVEKNEAVEHIKLALKLFDNNNSFKEMFVGFDLAGAEDAAQPEQLRKTFLPLLEKSIPTTIHAGENMPVKNIWQAIYDLSAERIGHGLSLNDDNNLLNRLKERKIAIEMCPTSNDQIIGYHDSSKPNSRFKNKEYPLKSFLKKGLKVTINTDDPGISRTSLTQEYYKAATMTEGGLSKWEILQIIRNGFKYGFLPVEEKKVLLINTEKELFNILINE